MAPRTPLQKPIAKILFLGDCNTLGTREIEGKAYPEKLGEMLNAESVNCGHTMCTTREASEYFRRVYDDSFDLVCLQYGLVDSWRTFIYSPYVLYYPDSKRRKFARKLTKKFKKWCKTIGLNRLLGTKNVVPTDEYTTRIEQIAQAIAPKPLILLETLPNKETFRNPEIERYNQAMQSISGSLPNVSVVRLYEAFSTEHSDCYIDHTHASEPGHEVIAKRLSEHIQQTFMSNG